MPSCSVLLAIRQMQIKTIVRYYNAPIKITKKDYLQCQCYQESGATETLIHCWWKCRMGNHYGKHLAVSYIF